MKSIISLIILFSLSLFSCQERDTRQMLTGRAQGTTFSLIYYSDNEQDISQDIQKILSNIDKSLSTYDSSSFISQWNKGIKLDTLDNYFLEMYLMSKHLNELTSGFFDPTVEPLSQFYGFEKQRDVLPNDIDSILQFVGIGKLKFSDNKLSKLHPKLKLNFNAIAQGYTVDLISDYLKSKAINNFIFELGGEVYCSGLKPEGKEWVVAVDKPSKERDGTFQNSLRISNLSITTSGNYRKWKADKANKKKYTHTINPKTGSSSPSDLLSVTVIHKSCAMADALSTALLSMKYNNALEFLEKNKIEVMLILESNGIVKSEYFNGFKNRIVD